MNKTTWKCLPWFPEASKVDALPPNLNGSQLYPSCCWPPHSIMAPFWPWSDHIFHIWNWPATFTSLRESLTHTVAFMIIRDLTTYFSHSISCFPSSSPCPLRLLPLTRALGVERMWGQQLQDSSAPKCHLNSPCPRACLHCGHVPRACLHWGHVPRAHPHCGQVGTPGCQEHASVLSLTRLIQGRWEDGVCLLWVSFLLMALTPNPKCSFVDWSADLPKEKLALCSCLPVHSTPRDFMSIVTRVLGRQADPFSSLFSYTFWPGFWLSHQSQEGNTRSLGSVTWVHTEQTLTLR